MPAWREQNQAILTISDVNYWLERSRESKDRKIALWGYFWVEIDEFLHEVVVQYFSADAESLGERRDRSKTESFEGVDLGQLGFCILILI